MRERAQLEQFLNHAPGWWAGDLHCLWQPPGGVRFEILTRPASPRWQITWGDGAVETSPLEFKSVGAAKADLRRRLAVRLNYLADADARPAAPGW